MPVYIKLNLPFCLYLNDGLYKVVVPEFGVSDPALIYLSKFRREKEKIDYITFWRAELVGRGELWNDRNGTFRRTAAIVVLPPAIVSSDLDSDKVSYHDDFISIIDAAAKALNRLITIYRFVTADTYVPTIRAEEVINTFEIGNCTITPDGSMTGNGHQGGFENRLTNTRPDYDEATHSKIRNMISTGALVPLFEEFMMSARSLLEERNWRAASIEAQTSFEVFVSEQVREHYASCGMDSADIDRTMKCGFMNLTNTHLGRATGKLFAAGETNFDRWYTDTYLLRNNVVHAGYLHSPQEAYDAVLGVEHALEYLIGRPKEKYWPKVQPSTHVNEFIVPDSE